MTEFSKEINENLDGVELGVLKYVFIQTNYLFRHPHRFKPQQFERVQKKQTLY